jgi:hypothetical protein
MAAIGVKDLLALPRAILSDSNSSWPLMLITSALGALWVWIAIGIWKRHMLAWQLGFVVIALNSVFFVTNIYSRLPAVGTGEKSIIIVACLVGSIMIGIFWSFIWFGQKKWFIHHDLN